MEAIIIDVTKGRLASGKATRATGMIPVEYYAKGTENQHFMVEYQSFRKVYKKAGKSTIIKMVDETKHEYPVLIHKIQYHPVTDKIIHVDVKAILKGQKITAKVPLVFTGEAPAVRELGGILVINRDEVTLECLPEDLPQKIEVNVSKLVDFHTNVTVEDIDVPKTIAILDAKNLSLATVSAPRKEEEEVRPVAPVEGEVATAEVPAEGEKAPEAAAKPEKKGKE